MRKWGAPSPNEKNRSKLPKKLGPQLKLHLIPKLGRSNETLEVKGM